MAEIIICPQCRRKLQLPPELIGDEVQCPSCEFQFIATPESTSPPPAPPPQSPPPYTPPLEPRRYEPSPQPRDEWSEGDPHRRPPRKATWDDVRHEYDDYRPRSRHRYDFKPHRGGTVLALGIISIFCCGIIFGAIAWSMGQQDLRAIRDGRMDPDGEGLTEAGRICGMIGFFMNIGTLLLGCLIAAAGG